MKQTVKKLINKIIVSCQAYEGTPLYGADYMKAMAQCAILGGAAGIRACWPQDISAIRSITDLPIVGINKISNPKINLLDQVIITPTFESACEVIDAGADILGIDCTLRGRSYDDLCKLLYSIKNKYPDIAILADISTVEEGVQISKSGLVDIIASTLSGYTRETYSPTNNTIEPDYKIVRELKERIDLPINAEGKVWELNHLKKLLDSGADMVTIGTAITRPHLITKRFVDFNKKYFDGKEYKL
ncbi:MAG TPA: N-acylglucosamine-6-phosphate 2-epimerase [Clostridiaceae bacterium]|nr:N-acylglucosamine-6-phosphate 2-epimerase [Clostridiaceae bacterium]